MDNSEDLDVKDLEERVLQHLIEIVELKVRRRYEMDHAKLKQGDASCCLVRRRTAC
jgi:hypothetical protein